MSRLAALSAVVLPLLLAAGPGGAGTTRCSVPDNLAMGAIQLPALRAAVMRDRKLTVLTVGGASVAGGAAGGGGASYPAQLQAELGRLLPGVDVAVVNKGAPASLATAVARKIPGMIAESGARLVIWSAGAREAATSADIDSFIAALTSGIAAARQAGAEVVLLDMQYAPSIARIMNSTPYREALRGTAESQGVALMERYSLMMHWSDTREMDLDAADKTARQEVARRVFACIAEVLAPPIARAAR